MCPMLTTLATKGRRPMSHIPWVFFFFFYQSDKSLHTLLRKGKWGYIERPGVWCLWWLLTWKEKKGQGINATYLSVIANSWKSFTSSAIFFSICLTMCLLFFFLITSAFQCIIFFLLSTLCTNQWYWCCGSFLHVQSSHIYICDFPWLPCLPFSAV